MRILLSVAGLSLCAILVTNTHGQAGQLDPTFNPGNGPNGVVHDIVALGDGSILVGGDFSRWNGDPSGSVVRLNANGSIDSSFSSDIGINARQLFVQQGGVLVVGPDSIVRLLGDGTRDTNFHSQIVARPVAATEDFIYSIFVPARPRPVLELRGPDGGILNSLLFMGSVGDQVYRLVPYSGNRVFLVGHLSFATLALFGSSGRDTTFQGPPARDAWNLAVAPDGSLYAALRFDNATSEFSLRHLSPSGAVDTNFADVGGTSVEFATMAVQNDGRLLYGARTVKRLNLDGSADTTFDPNFANSTIDAIEVQADGKILVGGAVGSVNGQAQPNIVRLLPEPTGTPGPSPTNQPPGPGPSPTNQPPVPGPEPPVPGPDLGLTISGRVTDGENGIAGVKVRASRRNVTFTDESGAYVLVVPKPGRYAVRAMLPGTRFRPSSQRVRVRDEDVVLSDFVVKPKRGRNPAEE